MLTLMRSPEPSAPTPESVREICIFSDLGCIILWCIRRIKASSSFPHLFLLVSGVFLLFPPSLTSLLSFPYTIFHRQQVSEGLGGLRWLLLPEGHP